MKILFVFTSPMVKVKGKPLDHPGKTYFGISFISSNLKHNGHQTELIVLSKIFKDKNYRILDETIKRFSPDVLFYTSVTSEFSFVVKMAEYTKKTFPLIKSVIGGVHVTLSPESVDWNIFDACCIGEGEEAALEYIQMLSEGKEPTGIRNFWLRHSENIEKNSCRPFIEDIGAVPFADRDMWEPWIEGFDELEQVVMLGRGCPFICTYCSNHALKKITTGKYVRMRPTQNILDEIIQLKTTKPKIKKIYLEVETIGINIEWTIDLCNKLRDFNKTLDTPIEFGANYRIIPKIDMEELFRHFQEANIKYINIGLESGSERIRREVLKRNYSNEDFLNAVRIAKKNNIDVHVYNMLGLPTETREDIMQTIAVTRQAQPYRVILSVFFPYPGTQLYHYCREHGYIDDIYNVDIERTQTVLHLPGITKKEIDRFYYTFNYHVYKGHRNIVFLLSDIIIRRIMSGKLYIFFNRLLVFKGLRKFLRALVTGMKR